MERQTKENRTDAIDFVLIWLVARLYLMKSPFFPEYLSLARDLKKMAFKEYLASPLIPLFEKTRIVLLWSCPHVTEALFNALGN